MNLQNGYKVIYEKAAEGKRTFYATKTNVCDPTVDDKIVEAAIGEYKLIYEKDGQCFGSVTGVPTEEDHCFTEFDTIFKLATEEPKTEEPKTEDPKTEEPKTNETVEVPAEEESVSGSGDSVTEEEIEE